MNISISAGLHNVRMDDSGVTITWQMFAPWSKNCSITDALKVMQRGAIVSTVELDENNTLSIVADQTESGYAVVISNNNGSTEARYTFMGRNAFKMFFDTLDPSIKSLMKYIEEMEEPR